MSTLSVEESGALTVSGAVGAECPAAAVRWGAAGRPVGAECHPVVAASRWCVEAPPRRSNLRAGAGRMRTLVDAAVPTGWCRCPSAVAAGILQRARGAANAFEQLRLGRDFAEPTAVLASLTRTCAVIDHGGAARFGAARELREFRVRDDHGPEPVERKGRETHPAARIFGTGRGASGACHQDAGGAARRNLVPRFGDREPRHPSADFSEIGVAQRADSPAGRLVDERVRQLAVRLRGRGNAHPICGEDDGERCPLRATADVELRRPAIDEPENDHRHEDAQKQEQKCEAGDGHRVDRTSRGERDRYLLGDAVAGGRAELDRKGCLDGTVGGDRIARRQCDADLATLRHRHAALRVEVARHVPLPVAAALAGIADDRGIGGEADGSIAPGFGTRHLQGADGFTV